MLNIFSKKRLMLQSAPIPCWGITWWCGAIVLHSEYEVSLWSRKQAQHPANQLTKGWAFCCFSVDSRAFHIAHSILNSKKTAILCIFWATWGNKRAFLLSKLPCALLYTPSNSVIIRDICIALICNKEFCTIEWLLIWRLVFLICLKQTSSVPFPGLAYGTSLQEHTVKINKVMEKKKPNLTTICRI